MLLVGFFFFLQNAFYYSLDLWGVVVRAFSVNPEHFILQFQSVLLSLC